MKEFKLPNTYEEKSILKTIRLKYTTLQELEKLSKISNISINRLINECIIYALNNLNQEEINKASKKETINV